MKTIARIMRKRLKVEDRIQAEGFRLKAEDRTVEQ